MSEWKSLPRPVTPGPWASTERDERTGVIIGGVKGRGVCDLYAIIEAPREDRIAMSFLPEYVAEVDRLRAWVDCLTRIIVDDGTVEGIRSGAWPDK